MEQKRYVSDLYFAKNLSSQTIEDFPNQRRKKSPLIAEAQALFLVGCRGKIRTNPYFRNPIPYGTQLGSQISQP